MINQFAGRVCSQTFAQHIANGISDHGDDFLFGVGTPILAPFSGTLRDHARPEAAPFQALYIATIQSDADPAVQMLFMHLSKFALEGHYNEGDTIGLSGGALHALGSGAATGPHIHVAAVINGIVRPYTDAFAQLSSFGPVAPIAPSPPARPKGKEETMNLVRNSAGEISAVFPVKDGSFKRTRIDNARYVYLQSLGYDFIQIGDNDYNAYPVSF
jgi:murein DD-endopeptidase MepM/ murein hydrolase activator NlpD